MINSINGMISLNNYVFSPLMSLEDIFLVKEPSSFQIFYYKNGYKYLTSIQYPKFFLGLSLNNDRLEKIFLSKKLSEDVTDDWSEEQEKQRKIAHDKLLQSTLGAPPYQYNWGEVVSLYDSKSGGSNIVICYKSDIAG